MASTTIIKLAPELKAREKQLAERTGRSIHRVIVEAVERLTAHDEKMRDFVDEALAADVDIQRTGVAYRAKDVHAWLDRLATGNEEKPPKPWRR